MLATCPRHSRRRSPPFTRDCLANPNLSSPLLSKAPPPPSTKRGGAGRRRGTPRGEDGRHEPNREPVPGAFGPRVFPERTATTTPPTHDMTMTGVFGRVGRGVVRRGVGRPAPAVRFASTEGGAASTERAQLTVKQTWLLSQINQVASSSSKEIHELRMQVSRKERELSAALAAHRDAITEAKFATAETVGYAVVVMGMVGMFAMFALQD